MLSEMTVDLLWQSCGRIQFFPTMALSSLFLSCEKTEARPSGFDIEEALEIISVDKDVLTIS